ncbi:MAG TPA: sigma-54 dependent transcriptional regulator [Terriglobia bacterium]|nr:sigma-54 dependent transcriptional regulator [Terriglobia bacterium]
MPVRMQPDGADHFVIVLIPELGGLQTLEILRQVRPSLKVSMLARTTDFQEVARAMRSRCAGDPTESFQLSDLEPALQHSPSVQVTPPGAADPEQEIEELGDGLCFIAASAAMRKIRDQVDQIACVNVPVLLLGESGTGKEIVARLIHQLSSRASRTFLKVNCAALPADLLESELFGYEVGAFTGATRPKPGKFEICDKGTILLDEIGELPASLQAKLLHVLQDQEFQRLGGRTTIRVDVRILAATNVNIAEAIAAKKLREDLYYRLNAFTLNLPPLRERREEIPLLLTQFMVRYARQFARTPLPLSTGLVDACIRYSWPGNLRELENFVKRYLILGDESLVRSELKSRSQEMEGASESARISGGTPAGGLKSLVRGLKEKAEVNAISRALEEANWDRKHAAQRLGISYKTLSYKVNQYGI